uniref:Cysteine-type peptidase n=1 Tax=Solanum tuberosum TaxID=4113 RepID=M1CHT9_SOLTU
MTRILVQRGSAGASSSSSSNQNRSSTSLPGSSSSSAPTQPLASSSSQVLSALKDDDFVEEIQEQVALEESSVASSNYKGDGELLESLGSEQSNNEEKIVDNEKRNGGFDSEDLTREFDGLGVVEEENEESSVQRVACSSCPPPPPVPPPKPASLNSSPRRFLTGSSHAIRIGSSRGTAGRSTFSTRTSPAGSRPSSPRSHCESEGYNSADEQNPNFGSSYDDVVCPITVSIKVDYG